MNVTISTSRLFLEAVHILGGILHKCSFVRELLFNTRSKNVMRANLLSTQVLVSASIKVLALRGQDCIRDGLVMEGVHMLLKLEVHWVFINTLIVLKKVLLMSNLVAYSLLPEMRRKLRHNCESCVDRWKFVGVHIVQQWTFLSSIDSLVITILRKHSVP